LETGNAFKFPQQSNTTLGVRYRVLADGELNHTGALVLLDAEGRIVARSTNTSGSADPQFLGRVRKALAKPSSN
jgi:protein SCO1/2